MKTVHMLRDFDYRPHPRMSVRFMAGVTYLRVIDAASTAIVAAGAGRVVPSDEPLDPTGSTVDARNVWTRKRRR